VESHYNGELTAEQWNGLNIRLAIWTCGMEVIKANPLIGAGLGDKEKALTDEYKKKDFRFGIRTNKNMHSNYLDLFASMGLIGFGLFVIGFLILPMRGIEILGALILIDFMLSFFTETYIDRSMGCVMFGFWVSLLLSFRKTQVLSST
ncbi:MAG: O-antigen ligase domain-containing protein, partial [Chitinophagaceae bacterium]